MFLRASAKMCCFLIIGGGEDSSAAMKPMGLTYIIWINVSAFPS